MTEETKSGLNDNLLMFFTGFTRTSSEIQKESRKMEDKKKEMLKEIDAEPEFSRLSSADSKAEFDSG